MPHYSHCVIAIDWRQMLRSLAALFIVLLGFCGANSYAQDCDPWWSIKFTYNDIVDMTYPPYAPLPNFVFEQGEFTGPKVLGTIKGSLKFINCRDFSKKNVIWKYRHDKFLSPASGTNSNWRVDNTTARVKLYVGCVSGRCTDINGKTVKTSAWNTTGIEYDITWTFTGSGGKNGSNCTKLTQAGPHTSDLNISTVRFWATIDGCTSLTFAYNIVISQVAAFTPSNVTNIVVGSVPPVGQLNGFADLVPEEGFINYDDDNCVPYDVGYHPQCMGLSPLMLMRGSYNLVTDKPPQPPPIKNCKVVLSSRPRR